MKRPSLWATKATLMPVKFHWTKVKMAYLQCNILCDNSETLA